MLETLAAALIAIQGGYNPPSGPPPVARSEPRATAAQPTRAPLPTVAAVPGRTLKDLPNATIRYFDVTGKNQKAINKSIARQQQADSSRRAAVSPTSWAVNTTFSKITSGGQCKTVDAKATFSATISLPRLVSDKAHTPALLATWRNYLANTENVQAANLWFVYDRIGDVEKAILASSCEGAPAASAAAANRLKAQEAEFQRLSR
jgi:predicted secreted Zn-dependent protease